MAYLLCAVTALACTWLLLRGYRRSGVRLLLWCGIFFVMLSIENIILFVDVVIFPEIEMDWLIPVRRSIAVVGVALLLYGLIWETD
jgi:hypothetical protein